MTITEYLTARYDEDEAPVRGAPPGARHVDYHASDSPDTFSPSCAVCVAGWPGRDRFLADIAAKRAILALHKRDADPLNISADTCVVCTDQRTWNYDLHGPEYQGYPCQTVRALLQPYADRDGFDPAWRAT